MIVREACKFLTLCSARLGETPRPTVIVRMREGGDVVCLHHCICVGVPTSAVWIVVLYGAICSHSTNTLGNVYILLVGKKSSGTFLVAVLDLVVAV